jgi:hypothetical protein
MAAEELGHRLVPIDVVTSGHASGIFMTFTRVEFANGNEKMLLNLNDFIVRGLSMTGTITVDNIPAGAGQKDCSNLCGPRPNHSSGQKGQKWQIRLLMNIQNHPDSGTEVHVVDIDLVKCPYKLIGKESYCIITEDLLCRAVSARLVEHVSAKIIEIQSADMVQQLIVVEDPVRQSHTQTPTPTQTPTLTKFPPKSVLAVASLPTTPPSKVVMPNDGKIHVDLEHHKHDAREEGAPMRIKPKGVPM